MKLVVRGIQVPFGRDGELTSFITPDWEDVMRFYPVWRQECDRQGLEPWPIQPFMLEVLKALERGEARPGRTQQDWMQRLIQHFGLHKLEEWQANYETL